MRRPPSAQAGRCRRRWRRRRSRSGQRDDVDVPAKGEADMRDPRAGHILEALQRARVIVRCGHAALHQSSAASAQRSISPAAQPQTAEWRCSSFRSQQPSGQRQTLSPCERWVWIISVDAGRLSGYALTVRTLEGLAEEVHPLLQRPCCCFCVVALGCCCCCSLQQQRRCGARGRPGTAGGAAPRDGT